MHSLLKPWQRNYDVNWWPRDTNAVGDVYMKPCPSLSELNLHRTKSKKGMSCILHFSAFPKSHNYPSDSLARDLDSAQLKAVLEFLATIEKRVNLKESAFEFLDVAFLVVGSAVEGTRIQSTNEADCMVFFR